MTTSPSADAKEHLVMTQLVSLTYREDLTPNLVRYGDALLEGRILGQKCPSCARVYVPGKGYCPMCVVTTGAEDEVEVSDRGIVTGYTIITPVQYYGQQKTEPFVYASVLLDGADNALGGQDIVGVPHDQLRAGMRVKAVWRDRAARTLENMSNRGWGSVTGVIDAFEATGEEDASLDHFREHLF